MAQKKNQSLSKLVLLAGALGLEPRTKVLETHVGGYRVADKWLKERCGRNLNYDDLEHYQSVIAALARTVEIQAGIDDAIEEAGGWPLR